jgi:hypothetical protein
MDTDHIKIRQWQPLEYQAVASIDQLDGRGLLSPLRIYTELVDVVFVALWSDAVESDRAVVQMCL